MQDLPVFEAVVEVIQAILLSYTSEVSNPSIGVDIKAKKRLHYDHKPDCQVFYVRVCSCIEWDLSKCFGDGFLRRLTEVLLYMQDGENEGHLSVQRPATVGPPGLIHEVLWLNKGDKGAITLKCQHTTHVPSVDTTELSPFVIHFRVVQKERHIISAGHQIHKFLHKLKLLKEKVLTSFSMKVCGAVCQTDFSVKTYLQVKDWSVVDDIKYFFGRGCLKTLWCGTVKAFTGKKVRITDYNQSSLTKTAQLSVSTLASFFPLTERYPQTTDLPGISGHIVINFYGPELTPLLVGSNHLQEMDTRTLTNWEQFSLCLKDTVHEIQSDVKFSATLTNLRYLPTWASECTSFLLCLVVVFVDDQADHDSAKCHDIIRCLQDDPKLLRRTSPHVNESLTSSLRHIFVHRETLQERLYRKTYVECSEMISSSMCDIFNHSTDVDFRSKMIRLVQVENKEDLKNKLKTSLAEIARVSEDNSLQTPDACDTDEEIDGWENDVPDVGRKQKTNPSQDTLLSQQSAPESSQPLDSEEQEINNQDNDRELLSDIQELDDFDENMTPVDQHWNSVSYDVIYHNLSQQDTFDMNFSDASVPIHHDELELTEDYLDFFEDHSRTDPHHSMVVYSQGNENNADAAVEVESILPSAGISTQEQSISNGTFANNTISGDEWLHDAMLDMADWI